MKPEEQRIARFMAKVKKTDSCWNWTGATGGSGYGQFWIGDRNIPAHWFLMPEWPTSKTEACHKCDNKLCVNPDHIFIGTRSDNMRDMVSKNRHNTRPGCLTMLKVRHVRRGESNHEAVLSNADVAIIRAINKRYGLGRVIASYFGVSETVISGIWLGKRWTHIQPDTTATQGAELLLKTIGKWTDQ